MSDKKNEEFILQKLKYTQKRLDSIYQNSPLAFISWNREGDIIDLNLAAEELFGWDKEEIKNKDFISTIIAKEDRDVWRKWKNSELDKLPHDFMSRSLKNDGSIISCSWNNAVIEEDGSIEEVISIAENLNNDLERELEMIKLVKAINETDNWIVITDQEGVIEYANTTVQEITGYKKDEVIGKDPSLFKSDKHNIKFYKDLWQTIKSGEVFNDVIINKKKNGDYFYSEQTITPIKDHNHKIINYISVGRDITQNEKLRRKIEYISNYDVLFGLPNRKSIRNKIDNLIEVNVERKIAVLVININRIKYLNDIYTDSESNNTLINLVANLINKKAAASQNCVRLDQNNFLSYLGGDNFAIIVDKIDLANEIYKIAENLLSVFSDPIDYNYEPFMLNARIGISVYPDDCISSQNLLSNAEIALINIKKNDYAFFDQEMNQKIKEFTKMEAKLDQAIKNDEFIIYYQPYYRGKDKSLYGMEALIRWQDPEKGIISPAEFIPILENSQLIKKVGLLVIRKVVNCIKQWLNNGYEVVPVSINLSARQLEDSSHLQNIYQIIAESGINNSLIKFEITESSAMDDVNYSLKIMNDMKAKGFAISIDDFGTGYSSFSYLQKFPIDYLKIDISFIRNMTLSDDGKNIVESIINIAHLLNLKTIAEGVEKEIELEKLNQLENDLIQGYYFNPPMSEAEIEKIYVKK
ncbi:PAS domain S-box-containing protein/diguanylate cyclase (GGDEF)-like protein [Halanaerobium saccharolyticum]|uniref:PAS domain S-box-containing protein/diguanylate cyclase (GGDEF)-like protein n=1 Tax=Halanaerobium saccharolyticum TaxID=43595 RepID=A0A4V3G4I2_9FIRM|nr:bifunctional diguanylate cyclase/phosphodiesterase [Halanaerobium saccharolyticum]RAK06213.1 PAS domain S-box-containing protein/diguanylate cyclase (GGDEF)-like protein [Halanaerobium saccharolyticum]TDW00578.1 PAS domain S-box-containing protein/diguanylate cyclase (GGDEF)-like protein [Halanaerobium saccharolyticum]TDX52243.1 PAS domain S-box-containing protein/diguanylate cyclase (GGDEF)-like protein [Halanaerobium saccharolyticum]